MKKNYIFTLLLAFCFSNLSFGQGSEVFTNSTATNSYADGSFVGEGDITWTFVKSRQASGNFNDTDITSMDLPALLLRRASDDSKITSNTISGGLADFSVKMYKGFTGGGNRQVELFVNGESKGTSEVFDDYTEHVFAVTGVNIAGDVVIELKNTTEKQVIIDEITWTAYDTAVGGVIDPMDDFEGNGNITWAADGDTGMDIAFANPSSTGINTSATVLEYSDTGQQYANINFDLSTDTSVKYDLSTKNVFTLKVFVPTPDVAVTSAKTLDLKLQDHSSSTPWVGQQAVSVAYEYDVWQELTFDFSAQSGATNFSRIVVQFNGENNFEVVKAYIDDLSYGEAATAGVESNVLLGFSMYPNPASNRLNISATETIQNAEIYNILGKNVMSVNVNDTKVSLDISNLAAGIYIVKYNANDKIGSAKFIKQ